MSEEKRLNPASDPMGVVLDFVGRRPGKTTCPSEVARVLASEDPKSWRKQMSVVHAAVDELVKRGEIRLSWKSRALPARSGPYRIGEN